MEYKGIYPDIEREQLNFIDATKSFLSCRKYLKSEGLSEDKNWACGINNGAAVFVFPNFKRKIKKSGQELKDKARKGWD